MHLATRKITDRAFTSLGVFSTLLVAAALLILLLPIVVGGVGAYCFRGTVEFRRMLLENFARGDQAGLAAELEQAWAARQPVFDALARYEAELSGLSPAERRARREPLNELKAALRELLGPLPDEPTPMLPRLQYGQTRWDRAKVKLEHVLYTTEWVQSDPSQMARPVLVPRVDQFRGTQLEPVFDVLARDLVAMLRPRWTFYPSFLTDKSVDVHVFGGIWAEVLGTLYLTLGAVLFAVPIGVLSAIYLVEYARENAVVGFIRSCISTLAGVPSIVFGLFGLAFFLNTLQLNGGQRSVLAGALTLALLILPVIIRAAEEAIRAVPHTFKEASLSLGASRWHTVLNVVLPAALPGILTGIVISMGRAAGETAPIIFTAAVSVGQPLQVWETLNHATPALPWNIYNLCTEHEAAAEIRHVQYGMVLTLVALVLLLNCAAIFLRARVSRRLTG